MAETLVDEALGYARRGLRVFPVHSVEGGRCDCGREGCGSPGKHPRTSNGFKDASTDEQGIREWWSRWPMANIGIATGSGLGVVDVDPRHGGGETLALLEAQHGALPETEEVSTGGGGSHLYLRVPEGTQSRKVGTGLDFKAEGGYVVAPPSRHATGGVYTRVRERERPQAAGELQQRVLDALDNGPACMDELGRRTGLSPGDLAALLAQMELAGLVQADAGVYRPCVI